MSCQLEKDGDGNPCVWKAPLSERENVRFEDEGATLYWSNTEARWLIQAVDVIWFAPTNLFQGEGDFNKNLKDNELDDDRQFPGLQVYFGDKPSTWSQSSVGLGTEEFVTAVISRNIHNSIWKIP